MLSKGKSSVANKKKRVVFFEKKNVFLLKAKKKRFFVFIAQFKGKVKFEVYFKCTVKIKKKSLNEIIRH